MITAKDAKRLMIDESPVMYKGIEYKKISALIYRRVKNKFIPTVELFDKCDHSVTIARLDWIEEIKTKNFKEERSASNDER